MAPWPGFEPELRPRQGRVLDRATLPGHSALSSGQIRIRGINNSKTATHELWQLRFIYKAYGRIDKFIWVEERGKRNHQKVVKYDRKNYTKACSN